jgi:outer membrane autotransporter protein
VYTWTKGGNLFKVGPSVTDTLPPNTGLQPVPYTYQLQVCNPVNQCQQAAASVTVTVAGAFTFSPPSGATFSATAQTQFNQTITATSSAPGVAFTSVAGLPVGLTATPSGGVLTISGTPATPGSSTIDVAVTDSQGSIGRATYTLVVVGLASNIVIVSGNQQTVPALTAVAPLTVLVTNNGVPAPGVTVSWSQTGGGTLGSATTVTGSNGQTSNSYITGPQDIENTVTARVGASTAVFTIKNTTVSIVKPAQTLIGPLAAAAIAAPTIQLNNIRLRLDQLRLQTSPTLAEALKVSVDGRSLPPSSAFALAPLDKDGNTVRGGGAAADNPGPSDRWSVFINGDIDIGKQSTMGTQTGFKVRSKGVTIGADYRFVGNHALGASVGFVNSDTDLDANAGTQNTEGYSFSLYGTYVPAPNAYLYGSLNVGHNSYDGTRRGEAGSTFNNSTSGNQWAIEIGGGYAFNRSPVAMTPYGRLQYVDAKINGFTENGDPEATLTISEQRIKSTLLGVGGTISYAIETSWGHVIPNGRLEYLYLANLNTQSATAQIAGSAQTQIEVSRPDKNYGLFAVGISWIHRGLNAFFNYQQQFGKQNFTDQMYTLGVKYEF